MRISDWSSDVCSSDLHNVSIFHCDHAGRIANAVRARRTGRDNGVVRAHQAIFNTDLPRNQVDETTMNEMWGNAARSLFVEKLDSLSIPGGPPIPEQIEKPARRRSASLIDRKGVAYGKSVSVGVDLGGS